MVVGTFGVNWTASDSGSGVAQSLAYLDEASPNRQLITQPGPVQVAPGAHTLDIYAEDRAGNQTTQHIAFVADGYTWLAPLSGDGFSGQVGRTIPVKFTVTTPRGAFVSDQSVQVSLLDAQGNTVVGPFTYAQSPDTGVVIQGKQYHVNLSTAGLASGVYTLTVRFSSAQLTGGFSLPVTLR